MLFQSVTFCVFIIRLIICSRSFYVSFDYGLCVFNVVFLQENVTYVSCDVSVAL